MIEEEDLNELEKRNSKYINFNVSNIVEAKHILENEFDIKTLKVSGNNIMIYDTNLPIAAINTTFIKNGLEVSDVHLYKDTLEDYFKKVTGGEGIA